MAGKAFWRFYGETAVFQALALRTFPLEDGKKFGIKGRDVPLDPFVVFGKFAKHEVRVGPSETRERIANRFDRSARAESGDEANQKADAVGNAVGDDGSRKSFALERMRLANVG